jgi:polyferredoxin
MSAFVKEDNMQERTVARLRIMVQAGFALICLIAGYRFYLFYLWATGQSDRYIARPASVEGFLPISALLGLKRLVLTGKWDEVHPAGLTILIFAIATALLLRKAFCGWVCPVGFVSNLLAKLGGWLNFERTPPRWLDYPLLSLKYLLLAFFGYIILWQMDLGAIEAFMYSQYNLVADAKMLLFFMPPSKLTVSVLVVLALLSLFIRNFWCRYLCPYGALLGLGGLISLFQVKRNASRCIDCKKCEKVCPASIRVPLNLTVRHAECIGCAECVEVCPEKDCLSLQALKVKAVPLYSFAIAAIGLFVLFWVVAELSGYWHTEIPPEAFRRLYPSASALSHP